MAKLKDTTITGGLNVTGDVILEQQPTVANNPATKKYVDDAVFNLPMITIENGGLADGQALTSIVADNHEITATKATFFNVLSSTGSGNAITNITSSGKTLTATKGNVGTVTSVGGTGTVSGLTLSGTVSTTGNLTLGGTLSVLPSNFASQTAKTFLAAPNASNGTPTFRTIVASDVPTLNQNTTGTAKTLLYTVLPSGTDLDTLKTPGVYGSSSTAVIATLVNVPVTGGLECRLNIEGFGAANYISQTFSAHFSASPTFREYRRYCFSSTWTAWSLVWDEATLTNPVTGTGTANQIAYYTGSTSLASLNTSTYPSLTELSYVKGVTSAIQTQLNGKEPSFSKNTAFNKNFGSTAGTVAEGNDYRLSNARTPTAHTHDDRYYTEGQIQNSYIQMRDLQVNLNGVPSNNLGAPTIAEMALFQEQFSNKTEFYDISKITFETYDGTTWADITSSIDATQRKRLMGGNRYSSNIQIPNGCVKYRITLRAVSYVFLNALYCYWSGQGNRTQVHMWKKHDSGSWTQHTNSTASITSWPGHMFLPFTSISWHPNATLGNHFHEVRIEFTPTWNNSNGIALSKLQLWGGYPADKRDLYTTDEDKRVLFPSDISVGNSWNNKVQTIANMITTWGASPTNTTYPSAKLVKDTIDALVMGTVTTIDGGTI